MWFFLIASTFMQMAAQRQQARAAAQEAEYERQNALMDARRAASEAAFGEKMMEAEGVEAAYEGAALEGTQQVNMAARGGQLGVGSNLLLRFQMSDMNEWQQTKAAMYGRFNIEQRQAEAAGYKRKAAFLSAQKRNIRIASRYKQAGTILGAAGQAYGMRGGGTRYPPDTYGGGVGSNVTNLGYDA